jgi:DNA-binding NarL/FixJ family response regulator
MATVFLRVVVADDSLVLREGVVRLLEAAGFDVVAEAGDGEQLLAAVRAHVPDAAAVDIRMPPTHSDEAGEPRWRSAPPLSPRRRTARRRPPSGRTASADPAG